MYQTDIFENKLKTFGITLNEYQIQQFMTYYEMLAERNKYMNLTAIIEFDEVIDKHFVDSLSLIKAYGLMGISSDLNTQNHLNSQNDSNTQNHSNSLKQIRMIDVGTGAGFPGIPLKIAFPNINVTLLDSLNKRVNFLNEVIDALKLTEIKAVHGRAEDFGHNNDYREKFDLCVSRAVANLATLGEYCLPFVKVGGQFIPYKSGNIDEELRNSKRAIKILGGQLDHVETFTLPDTDIERSLVVINKLSKTGKSYPRKAGKPSKEPLI